MSARPPSLFFLTNTIVGLPMKFRNSWELEKRADVKVSLKLSVIKPLHAKWIADLCNALKDDKEMPINGLRRAVMTPLRMPKVR